MEKCPSCGRDLHTTSVDDEIFCLGCGARVGTEREWRIPTGPILAACFCVLIGVFAFFLYGMGAALETPPAYPRATEEEVPVEGLPTGCFAKIYVTASSGSAVADWYRREMPARGWTIEKDMSGQMTVGPVVITNHSLLFVKGNTGALFSMAEGAPKFMLLWGPREKIEEWMRAGAHPGFFSP